ncbi:MAG: (2Fe-2S)-binding protein [Pseudomonadota bacterium]
MLVCHCHALTDRDIRRAVRTTGACSVAEVGDCCGATTGCGGCYEVVAEIVAVEKRRLAMFPDGADSGRSGPGVEQALPGLSDLQLTG